MKNCCIVVPVDFSIPSMEALQHATVPAHYYDADIELVHLMQEGEDRQECEKKLSELQKQAGAAKVTVVKGDTEDQLIQELLASDPIFLVTGFNSGSRKGLGKLARRIISQSYVPVITVKKNRTVEKYQAIVLPLDLTAETTQKVEKAIDLARRSGSTKVFVITVLLSVDEYAVNKLTRQMLEVRELLEENGIQCSCEIIKTTKGEETQAEVISDFADKVNADLIMIMSTSGQKKKQELDKDALELITLSKVPVLSILPR